MLTQEILFEQFSRKLLPCNNGRKNASMLKNNSQKGNNLKRITVVSKNGVANSHEVSWRNAVKAIDQERCAAN